MPKREEYIYFVLTNENIYYPVQPSLKIVNLSLGPENIPKHIFDMSGRCAFVVCTKGGFDVKILNEINKIKCRTLLACMPFVNIDVVRISTQSEVIIGYINISDIPTMINRWINTNNLNFIQDHPTVEIPDTQFFRLRGLIFDYINDIMTEQNQNEFPVPGNTGDRLRKDIIDLHGRLIVALVIKLFLSNREIEISGHTHDDVSFQRFMLDLYAHFRERRDVHYYASHSGVSIKYFSTKIRQLSGKSPSRWIETVVIGEAKSLLVEIHRSIKEIATILNFPDAPTFTKYFHRVTGMSPKYYRKTYANTAHYPIQNKE